MNVNGCSFKQVVNIMKLSQLHQNYAFRKKRHVWLKLTESKSQVFS